MAPGVHDIDLGSRADSPRTVCSAAPVTCDAGPNDWLAGSANPVLDRHRLCGSPGKDGPPATVSPYCRCMPAQGARLRMPSPRTQLVARDRLLEQLRPDPHSTPRLVLVSAPAGFGKTTVLVQWLSGITADDRTGETPHRRRVAWLSLDADDDESRAFLRHLVAALQIVSPAVGSEALALIEPGGEARTEDVVACILDDLDALEGATIIAFDDFHAIQAPAVQAAVAFLLEHLPPQVTVAMTTRADPPLPLARMRARGELVELRATDLRFTDQEAASFLNDVMGLALEPALVSALGLRTEGWAAGLQLAALSARGHAARPEHPGSGGTAAFVRDFSGSHRFVLDYLMEEVLGTQPEPVHRFLLDTSVLDELTGPLCDAVTGVRNGQQTLEVLERSNVFLVSLDDERQWFRYHHLFADALRAKLGAEDPQRVLRLHRAASDWHAEHGTLADAIREATAAGDPEHVADLVELALPQARRERRDLDLRSWLAALPAEVLRGRALLATQMVPASLSTGDLDGAELWLDVGEQALARFPAGEARDVQGSGKLAEAVRVRNAELQALPAQAAVYRAAVAQARGDIGGTVLSARRALDLAGPDDHVARSGGAGFLGLAAWAAGDLAAAVETFELAVRSLRAAGNVTDELSTTVVLADMWWARGRPAAARRLLQKALATATARPGAVLSTTADLHVGLAHALREQGDLDAAGKHLEAARELGERGSLPENRYRWCTAAAGLLVARGELEKAAAMLDLAEPLYRPGYFPDVRPVPAVRARVRIAQGRLMQAVAWAQDRHLTPDDPVAYAAEFDQLTLARLLIAQQRTNPRRGTLQAVHGLLNRIVRAAEAADRGGSLVDGLLVRALAHRAGGDRQAAIADLSRSLAAAVPAGYSRLFLDEGPAARELLAAVAGGNGRLGREEAASLLHQPEGVEGPTNLGAWAVSLEPHEALSKREVEVLRMLATDLTGPEIADRLFMSLNTFRTHTRHIFTKLDVTTRRAAVSRAGPLDRA